MGLARYCSLPNLSLSSCHAGTGNVRDCIVHEWLSNVLRSPRHGLNHLCPGTAFASPFSPALYEDALGVVIRD